MSDDTTTDVIETRGLTTQPVMELSVEEVGKRLDNIQKLQREKMTPKIDYGVIPGTGSKPTLLKAGAEKLCVLFRLDAQFDTHKTEHADGHITIETSCILYHQVTGQRLGAASAECSSRESKYAYRKAARKCPHCGKEAIIKGKVEYGGGWLCFKKKDGCGAKFADDDASIVGQGAGRVPNPDLPDEFPTVRRMAEKRALIAAVRLVTGASAIFDEPMTDAKDDDDSDLQAGFDSANPPPPSETTPSNSKPPKMNPHIMKGDVPVVAAAEIGKLKAVAAVKKGRDAFPWWKSKLTELHTSDETMTRAEYDAIKFELEEARPDATR